MRCTTVFVLLLCLASSLHAAESPQDIAERDTDHNVKAKPESVLHQAEKALRAALSDLKEEVTFEHANHSTSLTVKYQIRKFMVHGASMAGVFTEKAHEVEGPDVRGLLLLIHVQDKGTVNQAVVPQTLRQLYWRTDLDVSVVSDTDWQLYWGLSYGAQTDRGLLKKIRDVMEGLESTKTPQAVAVIPPAPATVKPNEPEVSLFDSVKTVKRFLDTKAKQDYSDKYLRRVSLHHSQGHPRKGTCWLYSFAFKQPRLGGDVSIYHFMDGKIVEFNHGP